MLVLPNQLLYWVLSTSDQCFVSFQPIWCHPHTQIRTILFHCVRTSIPNLETFSQPYFNRIFSNCLSHNSPAKGWPCRFRSRGTTGSSILDHDFGHLCSGRRIQMSGHSDLGIFSNFVASFIFTWEKADTATAACPAQPGSLEMTSMTFGAVICDADDPCSVNTVQDPESSFTISPRRTTRPLYFWCFASNSGFFHDMSISEAKWTVAPTSLLHRSPLSYFWLSSGSTPKFSPSFSHSLSTAAFAAGIFIAWGIGINLCTNPISFAAVTCLPFLQHGLHDDSVKILPYAVLQIQWLPKYTQVFIWSYWIDHQSPNSDCSCLSCKA